MKHIIRPTQWHLDKVTVRTKFEEAEIPYDTQTLYDVLDDVYCTKDRGMYVGMHPITSNNRITVIINCVMDESLRFQLHEKAEDYRKWIQSFGGRKTW